MTDHLERLIRKIESYPFESEGGPLAKCVDWDELKTEIESTASRVVSMRDEISSLRTRIKELEDERRGTAGAFRVEGWIDGRRVEGWIDRRKKEEGGG